MAAASGQSINFRTGTPSWRQRRHKSFRGQGPRTSSVSGLQARLQKRAEPERQQIEAVVQSQLNELSENLKNIVKRELNTIENDTKISSKRLSAAALKAWARPIMVGLLLFLGICGGSWGLTRWYSNQIQNLIERRAALTRLVEREQTRLDQLRAQTWGVCLHEAEDGARSVVLPNGTPLGKNWRWKVPRTACASAIERVKELYDRVRTAVDERLNRAVEAVRGGDGASSRVVGELQEQVQQLKEAVKDLKPQLGRTGALAEDLKQQVESLRADYREIAKVLRGV